ncbi:hypothetical protein [Cytobacillus horneckiae]|uniref:hypothetical protein n=1 Tax=Cytobacillus horneckiae TaxID=549687 RepID=UPI003D9A35FB
MLKQIITVYDKNGRILTIAEGRLSRAYELMELDRDKAVVAKVEEAFIFGPRNTTIGRTLHLVTKEDLEDAKQRGEISFTYDELC